MKNELLLKYEDGCFTNTYTYQIMKELSDEVDRLSKKLKRAKDIDNTFHRFLQDYGTMTDEQYRCYMSWCYHSDLSPCEIMTKYVYSES